MADGASCHACRLGQHGHEARSGAKVSKGEHACSGCSGQWPHAFQAPLAPRGQIGGSPSRSAWLGVGVGVGVRGRVGLGVGLGFEPQPLGLGVDEVVVDVEALRPRHIRLPRAHDLQR
eukprot:scaffold12581_cov49-Phaeocystis_antarctica.AAC.4